jgi:hypothetical protein
VCDGKGACKAQGTKACTPYLCDGTTQCLAKCTDDKQCANGYRCEAETCVPSTGKCQDINTWIDSKGVTTSCAPYTCQAGGCLEHCATTTDCASGAVCDTTQGQGVCIPQAAPEAPSNEGGCGCTTPARTTTSIGSILLSLAVFTAIRRRRRVLS